VRRCVCRSTQLTMDVPFATLVQAPNAELLAARRRRLESRGLLRGQMLYQHHLLRNAFHFEEAPKTDEGQNPNHCAGTRASWRVESRFDQTPAARCILDKAKDEDPRDIIDKAFVRWTCPCR
jgi:hypothetical protein